MDASKEKMFVHSSLVRVVDVVPPPDTSALKLNLLVLKKYFESSVISNINRIKRKDDSRLRIVVFSGNQADKLLRTKEVYGIEVKAKIPHEGNTIQGLFIHPEVAWLSEDELEELLRPQQVVEVRKMQRREGGNLVNFNTAVAAIVLLSKLPEQITGLGESHHKPLHSTFHQMFQMSGLWSHNHELQEGRSHLLQLFHQRSPTHRLQQHEVRHLWGSSLLV